MIQMGFDPYAQQNATREQMTKNGTKPDYLETFPELFAARLLSYLDESDKGRTLTEAWSAGMGMQNQFHIAVAMHDLIKKQNPQTRAAMVNTVNDCLAILFPLA